MPTKNINLVELAEKFHSEDRCRVYLEGLRWPQGVTCLRCGSHKISRIRKRGQFHCDGCGYQFSVRVGTIFQDSKLPLWKWFLSTYLMTESKKGISSNQLKRTLGVTYKTAWYLTHRIRAAMKDATPEPLWGIVEVDETWIGGKKRGIGSGNYQHYRTMVMGAIQRGGEVRLRVEKRRNRATAHKFIRDHIGDDTEAIYTDEHDSYDGIEDEDTRHEAVNHKAEEWVRGDVHTNTVESVWSLLDRSIIGAYHHLSAKHLPAYLDEVSWRFNNRQNPYLFRDALLRLIDADTLSYEELVSS